MQVTPIPFDGDQAFIEGWGLFDVSHDLTPQYEISREDDEAIFADDLEARAFVLNAAMGGSQYHRDALAVALGLHTPVEPAPMDLDAAQAALDVWGLNVVPRTELLMLPFPVHCYGDDTAKNAKKHEAVRTEWRNRVSQYPGAYVIYDPSADAEGWMLVGDDLAAIVKESVTHHEDIQL